MTPTEMSGWITAAATVVTALLTGTGGWAAWLALRREQRRDLPIIERAARWNDNHVVISLVLRNRLPERIALDELRVFLPKGAGIGSAYGEYDSYGNPSPPEKSAQLTYCPGYTVDPVGSPRRETSSGEALYCDFALWPPEGWTSGRIKIVARISTKSDTMHGKRMTVDSRVLEPPPKQSDRITDD